MHARKEGTGVDVCVCGRERERERTENREVYQQPRWLSHSSPLTELLLTLLLTEVKLIRKKKWAKINKNNYKKKRLSGRSQNLKFSIVWKLSYTL